MKTTKSIFFGTCVAACMLSATNANAGWLTTAELNDYIKNTKHSKLIQNPYVTIAPSSDGSWYKFYSLTARKDSNKGYTPDNIRPAVGFINFSQYTNADDYVFINGYIDKVDPVRMATVYTPFDSGTASCQTALPTISGTSAFSSARAMQTGTGTAEGYTYNSTTTQSVTEKLGFSIGDGVSNGVTINGEVSNTNSWSKESGTNTTFTNTQAWTDTDTYTKTWSTSVTVPGGTIGYKSFGVPAVKVTGVFHLGRVFNYKMKDRPAYDPNNSPGCKWPTPYANVGACGGIPGNSTTISQNTRWWIHSNDANSTGALYMGDAWKSGWYQGTIVIPQNNLRHTTLPNEAGPAQTFWALKPDVMTIAQYKTVCNIDIASRTYAPVMKAALCKAGFDTVKTCH